jgi:hypothetical protein
MHASIFSYNVTRPYPFKWFTPLVVIGGIVIAVLVTFLSISTSGYEMVSVYSANPNSTDGTLAYFSRLPSFMTANTMATCDSTTIPINSNFYTNNTAFSYTLSSIWQGDTDDPQSFAGSLPYHYNRLQHCSIPSIAATFENIERPVLQIARDQWGVSLKAFITCLVESPEGLIHVNLTTAWDLNAVDDWITHPFAIFPGVNQTSASLWWGQSLLLWYYRALTDNMAHATQAAAQADKPVYKGFVIMHRDEDTPENDDEIKSLGFFRPECYFIPFSPNGRENVYWCGEETTTISDLSQGKGSHILPGIWLNLDTLSKAMYFTVLADLGQNDASQSNILTNTNLLQYFSANFSAFSEWDLYQNTHGAMAKGPLTSQNASQWELDINPSVISTVYLCQKPQLKHGGTLVMAVLVADLVILQAIWRVFKFAVDFIAPRTRPEMMHCQGCVDADTSLEIDPELRPSMEDVNSRGLLEKSFMRLTGHPRAV